MRWVGAEALVSEGGCSETHLRRGAIPRGNAKAPAAPTAARFTARTRSGRVRPAIPLSSLPGAGMRLPGFMRRGTCSGHTPRRQPLEFSRGNAFGHPGILNCPLRKIKNQKITVKSLPKDRLRTRRERSPERWRSIGGQLLHATARPRFVDAARFLFRTSMRY